MEPESESGLLDASLQILRRARVFKGLPGPALEALAEAGAWVSARRRSVLTPTPAGVHVLGAGRVRVERIGAERDVTLGYVGAGGLVGEALLFGSTQPVRVVVTEDVEATRLPLEPLKAVLEAHGRIALRVAEIAVRRCLQAEGRLVALLNRSVESRVAEFLLEAAQSHGIPGPRGTLVGVRYTHQEIAGYVGSTRETVTVVLGELRRARVIEVDHRRILLVEPEALAARV